MWVPAGARVRGAEEFSEAISDIWERWLYFRVLVVGNNLCFRSCGNDECRFSKHDDILCRIFLRFLLFPPLQYPALLWRLHLKEKASLDRSIFHHWFGLSLCSQPYCPCVFRETNAQDLRKTDCRTCEAPTFRLVLVLRAASKKHGAPHQFWTRSLLSGRTQRRSLWLSIASSMELYQPCQRTVLLEI